MKRMIAKTGPRNYPVLIEAGILSSGKNGEAAKQVKKIFPDAQKVALVTDEKVLSIYKKQIDKFLADTYIDYIIIAFPDGEKEKNLENTEKIYHKLLDFNVHRNDLMIAFGGGVIGDLAGFAASTFHRGIKILQFPTTIISQVDSSIGGKVVVNLDSFKNIIGSFYQPHAVVIDPSLLFTLEEKEIINGLAEIVKYGIVFDRKIINQLFSISKSISEASIGKLSDFIKHKDFENIIYSCCRIKTDVVRIDEFDMGLRNLLNFGHTFGHAIERVSGLKRISHGMAVAMGMIIAIDLSIKLGLIKPEIKEEIIRLYKILKLPHRLQAMDIEQLVSTIDYDKKSTAAQNKYILLKGINRPVIYCGLDENMIKQSIKENMSE